MTHRQMDIFNIILYYVISPLMILEFILSDVGIMKFNVILFIVTIAVFFVMAVITMLYKRKHPGYEYKANDAYTKIIFLIVLFECMYSTGMFHQ